MAWNESTVHVYSNEEVSVLVAVTALILTLAVPTNILVLLGYLSSPSARRKPSNLLLINMAFSELLTILVVIPLQLITHCTNPSLARDDATWCKLTGVLTYPFYIVTVATMVCISVDRFYAIRAPLKYKSKMTAKCIGAMIIYTWLHATTFSFIFTFVIGIGYNEQSATCSIVWDDHFEVSVFVAITHILLPFVLLIFLNYNLVISLRKQNRNLVKQLDRELTVPARFARDSARHGRFLCGFIQRHVEAVAISECGKNFSVFFNACDNLVYWVKSSSLKRRTCMHQFTKVSIISIFLEFDVIVNIIIFGKIFFFQLKKEKLLAWYFGL